jgi:polar amino acid transport system substrate-binding protein
MKIIKVACIIVLLLFATLASAEQLKVVTEDFGPYNYIENGEVKGFSTEITKEVLKRADLQYTLNLYPWSESYNIAQNQPNVLIYSIGRTLEREHLFKWVGSVVELEVYFYKLKNRVDIKINSLDDLRRYKLGVVKDDLRHQFLSKVISTNKLNVVPTDANNLRLLFEHKIDAFPCDEHVAYFISKQEGFAYNDIEKTLFMQEVSVDLYLAFSMGTSDEIVTKCRKALEEIKKDGTYEKIKEKYKIFYLPEFQFMNY